jgi:hypothetical protein
MAIAGCAAALLAGSASAATLSWVPRIALSAHALNAVSCGSPALCVAVGNDGQAVTSTSPAGGIGTWSAADVDGSNRLLAVSCPTSGACFATDNHAQLLSSANPAGGAGAWRAPVSIDPGRWVNDLSCATTRLCVAVDRRGGVITATSPAGGSHSWKRVQPTHSSLIAVSCPSTKLCVAAESGRKLLVSTHPTGGARSWHELTVIPGQQYLQDISCANAHSCALIDVLNGTDIGMRAARHPIAAGIWRPIDDVTSYPHEGNAHGALSCTTMSFCAAYTRSDFSSGDVWVSSTGGVSWTSVNANDPTNPHLLSGISCAGPRLCVIVDQGGGAIVGS